MCELICRLIIVIVLVAMEIKSEEDPHSTHDSQQIQWTHTVGLVLILIALGLIAVIAATRRMTRDTTLFLSQHFAIHTVLKPPKPYRQTITHQSEMRHRKLHLPIEARLGSEASQASTCKCIVIVLQSFCS